ncbi:sterile alpha motif domain-containing protein 1-like [Harpia harpyja]|uniref:sterile alpha motif domain-containing protein 1-like n=1 Tax=Harpia harpyja TaxID=202280 RepID=UPI0022B0980A|nr:sterile alpha motif domain-containing protein 1-like [Harpia harpyja]
MPPGSAAPLGRRAEEGRPALSPPPPPPFPFPRLPRRQAPPGRGVSAAPGSLRARQGPRGAEAVASARAMARGGGGGGGVLSTRGQARDGDACNLWLNWSASVLFQVELGPCKNERVCGQ